MKVVICAITFHRPEGLGRLLRGLQALEFRADPPVVEIVIIDNDSARSAETVCDRMRDHLDWPLYYDVESQRGITFARNKAVDCALDRGDFLIFIDDDEVPEPGWLDELIRVQRAHDADIVTGPVVPKFAEDVPAWIERGGFFETPRYATGRRMDVAYTHNVMVRSDALRAMNPHFDNRLSLCGGEDSHLFRRLHGAGHSIIWADGAVVYESIPQSRACASWLIKRFYRIGNTMGLISIDLSRSLTIRPLLFAKSVVWGVIGMVVTVAGLVGGRHLLVRGIRYMAYGLGMLLSISGVRYEEYRKTHGT